jgi:hypothetical protein
MDAMDIKRATEDQGHGGLLEHMGAWYRTWRHDCGRRSGATNAEEAGSSRTIEKKLKLVPEPMEEVEESRKHGRRGLVGWGHEAVRRHPFCQGASRGRGGETRGFVRRRASKSAGA